MEHCNRDNNSADDLKGISRTRDDLREEEEEEEDTLEMSSLDSQAFFKACKLFGKTESLKSLEIPLEHLLSGVIFLSGGRDNNGRPVLSITQPEYVQVEMLMELNPPELLEMLCYFTSVPRDDVRQRGFRVIMDAEVIHDFLMRNFIKALNMLQNSKKIIHQLLFISLTKDVVAVEQSLDKDEKLEFPVTRLKQHSDLLQYVDREQLTEDFGGLLEYNHQDWVRFRMQVEPFFCDCLSISKNLTSAIKPFLEENLPSSVDEAEESLKKHKLVKQRTLDSLHVDELASEGEKIDQRVHMASNHLQQNPDFNNTLTTVQKLLQQISTLKGRLETLWTTQHHKLEVKLRQKKFEKEAEQQLIMRTDDLLQDGSELQTMVHTDRESIHKLVDKIRNLLSDFKRRLRRQKKWLRTSVKLHKLTADVLDWCIESAAFMSENDILTADADAMDPSAIKDQFTAFLHDYPPFTEEQIQSLADLIDRASSHFIKEDASFAYNRLIEINERFMYYQKILDSMIDERKKMEEKILQESENIIRGVDNLAVVATGGTPSNLEDKRMSPGQCHSESIACSQSQNGSDTHDQVSIIHNEALENALVLLESATSLTTERIDSRAQSTSEGSGLDYVDLDPADVQVHLSKKDISSPSHPTGALFMEEEEITESYEEESVVFTMNSNASNRKVSVIEEDDLMSQTKNARHRRKLMDELIQTENTYIQAMQYVCEHYMPAMDMLESLPRNLVGKKNVIFMNIPTLVEFNRQIILPLLLECRKCPIKLGQIFLAEEEQFLNYSMYFKNMQKQTDLLEDGGFDFFKRVQQELGDSLDLTSYLIKPFQRVTKYKQFLEDMMKHSVKSDLNGKLKEYYEKLKEAQKMIDFTLRHGNDLLAVECLKGFVGSIKEQGKILRQGDLFLAEWKKKHRRRAFLFEQTIVFAKAKKKGHKVDHNDTFEFKAAYKTSDLGLRENIAGHPNRFELWKRKDSLMLEAESEQAKMEWVQDIWDLFFSHMLKLKEQNLEAYGTRPLTSVEETEPGGASLVARSRLFGHSIRRVATIRHSSSRVSREMRSRPVSQASTSSANFEELTSLMRARTNNSNYSISHSALSPTPPGPTHSSSFVDLRPKRESSSADSDVYSNRSSVVSMTSVNTITGVTMHPGGGGVGTPGCWDTASVDNKRLSQLVMDGKKAEHRKSWGGGEGGGGGGESKSNGWDKEGASVSDDSTSSDDLVPVVYDTPV